MHFRMMLVKGSRKGEYVYGDKVVCRPQIYPDNRFSPKKLNEKHEYGFHELRDGTLVNLYWHGRQWRLGSARADDLRDMRYSTEQTFGDLFEEALGAYPEFGYERLDRGRTYTLGFSHPAMHNTATAPAVWSYYEDVGVERIELTPMSAATRAKQIAALGEKMRACGLSPHAPLGYVFVSTSPGRKSFVWGSPMWKVVKDCQNNKIPRESHVSRRAYIISRTLTVFRQLAQLGSVPKDFSEILRATLPGVAEDVLRLQELEQPEPTEPSPPPVTVEQLADLFERTFGMPTPACPSPAVVYSGSREESRVAEEPQAAEEPMGRVTVRTKRPRRRPRN